MAIKLENLNAKKIKADRNSVEIWLNDRITVDVAREVNRVDNRQISRIKIIKPATYVFEGLDEGSEIDWGPREIQSIYHTYCLGRGAIPVGWGIVEDDVRVESDTEERFHSPTNNPQVLIINFGKVNIKSEIKQSEIKKQNQTKILTWIRNGEFPNFDYDGYFVNPNEDPAEGVIHKNMVENSGVILNAIEEYIKNNPHRFYLSNLRHNRGEQLANQWWAQEIPDGDPRLNYLKTVPHKDKAGINLSGIREITFGQDGETTQNPALFPGNFTPEQYEKLKNLLPDNRVCKVNGCYCNHTGSSKYYNEQEEMRAVGSGLCRYHQRKQNGEPEKADEILNESNHSNDIFGILQKAQVAYHSNNLQQIKQAISELENIKANQEGEFNVYDGSYWLNMLRDKKKSLSVNEGEENTNQGSNNGGRNEPIIPSNNTNSALQKAKNKAIQEITSALVSQEPKLTTHDLQEFNQGWKKRINESNSEEEINNIKNLVLSNIQTIRKEKQKSQTISNELDQASGGTSEQQAAAIEKAEENEGESSYQDNADKVQNLKKEYFQKDKKGCLKTIVKTIENKLNKNQLSEGELSEKGQKILAKLKNEEINEINEINEMEKELNQEIGQKGATKKINNLVKEAEKVLKSGDKKQIDQLKDKLMAIINSSSIYLKGHKSQTNKLLNDLNRSSQNSQQSNPSSIPLKVIIPLTIIGIVGLAVLVVIIKRKRSKSRIQR